MKPHNTDKVVKYVSDLYNRVSKRPLIVGLSGPQGSGKSTVVKAVAEELRGTGKRVVEFSLDDVYLTHAEQRQLALQGNSLLQQRGLPGTHDPGLCAAVLKSLQTQSPVQIPQYDKSAFNGQGDRAATSIRLTPNYDIVLLEGWCVGFMPLTNEEIRAKCQSSVGPLSRHSVQSALQINEHLKQYQQIWDLFDGFVHLDAEDITDVYKWRLQQEHGLIAERGIGMTDDQVRAFVDGYMPAYELYNDRLRNYTGDKLHLKINQNRQAIKSSI